MSVRILTPLATAGLSRSDTRMGTSEKADIGSWRKIVELGSGRTGGVALCIEPISSSSPNEERTCGEHQHRVFQAIKRVRRQCAKNSGAIRQVLQEKKALQDLRGVGEPRLGAMYVRT